MLIDQRAHKQTYKDKKSLPSFTRVTHNSDIICENNLVYEQNGSQCEHAILT